MNAQVIPLNDETFLQSKLAMLDKSNIPRHIAFINDGNRRWAKKQKFTTENGHRKGADNLMQIVKAAKDIGIRYITFYVFSTENWNRPKYEVSALMRLLKSYLQDERDNMVREGVRLHTIGDLSRFPKDIVSEIETSIDATMNCSHINAILALNYGSRDEIKRSFCKILDDYKKGIIDKESITEELISGYLDTHAFPDPDLLIRTSGEMRLSNYLLWQSSYTEIFVTDVFWPDFSKEHLLDAMIDFQQRERRSGS